jgi:hypothetical protein
VKSVRGSQASEKEFGLSAVSNPSFPMPEGKLLAIPLTPFSGPQSLSDQVCQLVDIAPVEITQGGILTDFDEPNPWISH